MKVAAWANAAGDCGGGSGRCCRKAGKALAYVFAAVFAWIFIQALMATWNLGALEFAVVVGAALGVLAFATARRDLMAIFLEKLAKPAILVPVSAIASIALLIVSQSLSTSVVDGTWDFPNLGRDAYAIASSGTLSDARRAYYAIYPNNQLLLLVVSGLFQIVLLLRPQTGVVGCHHVAIALNSLLLIAAIALIACVLKRQYGPKAGAAFAFLSIFFTPFWCYAAIYYSDIIPMPLIALELLLFLESRKVHGARKAALLVGVALVAAFAFELKATTVFVFAGCMLLEALDLPFKPGRSKLKRVAGILSALVVAALLVTAVGHATQAALGISDAERDARQFPYTHWVMMSLGKTGGYNQDDVNFTRASEGKEQKQEANIEKIKERLEERGILGTLQHLFVVKVQRTWGNGCLAGDDYVNRYPEHPQFFSFSLFSQDGSRHGPVKGFTQAFWLLLLGAIVLGAARSARATVSPLAFIAMFSLLLLFCFELVWECNSRYVVHMSPLVLALAATAMFTSNPLAGWRRAGARSCPCRGKRKTN